MSAKIIKAELGITRGSDGNYYIRIGCETSHTNFCELKLTAKQFAEAITSLQVNGIHATVKGLDKVGKQRVRESRSVVCPHKRFGELNFEQWLVDNCQEEGWIIDAYLRSQTSIKSVDDGTLLNYAVYKYVEVQ
jgi:hypothetical protein